MESDPSTRKQSIAVGYIFAASIGMVLLQWVLATYNTVDTIPYSEFEQLVAKGHVTEVAVGQDTIQGKLKDKLPSGKSAFVTARVDPALAEKLAAKGVVVTGVPSGGLFQTILSWIVPALMFYLIWVFLGRRLADRQGFGGLMSIGKSRAKVYVEKDTKVTFTDVAGVDEAKFELQEVVSFLQGSQELRPARRACSQRDSAGRAARHRQDPARPSGGRRGRGRVLFHFRLRIRRDVRRRRRRSRPRPVRAGAEGGALHHLHRRTRCARAQPLTRRIRRLRREGADPQPAARRA